MKQWKLTYGGLPEAPDENSRYTVWVPVTLVMFARTVRQEDQPPVLPTTLDGCKRLQMAAEWHANG